eukprot:1157777-Pelagomonas_calceolata.AAC.2
MPSDSTRRGTAHCPRLPKQEQSTCQQSSSARKRTKGKQCMQLHPALRTYVGGFSIQVSSNSNPGYQRQRMSSAKSYLECVQSMQLDPRVCPRAEPICWVGTLEQQAQHFLLEFRVGSTLQQSNEGQALCSREDMLRMIYIAWTNDPACHTLCCCMG